MLLSFQILGEVNKEQSRAMKSNKGKQASRKGRVQHARKH